MSRAGVFALVCAALCGCDFDADLRHWQQRSVNPDSGVVDGGADAGIDTGADGGIDAGTDAGEDAGFDAGWVFAPDGSYNFAFLTSTQQSANQLGSVAAADRLCAALAADAGLPGIYAAWVSERGENAFVRTGMNRARGWLRTDGRPFADTPDELALGHVRYPMRIDERGNDVGLGHDYLTGLSVAGDVNLNCGDFTGQGSIETGCSGCGGVDWSNAGNVGCSTPKHLACFGVDQFRPLPVLPLSGPLIFISSPWLPGGGLAAADAWCNSEAAPLDAGAPFIAFLATAGTSAASRLVSDGGWVRIDGVRVGDLRAGSLDAPIILFLDGGIPLDTAGVFSGATGSTTSAGAPAYTCNDWVGADAGPTADARVGVALYSNPFWFDDLLQSCQPRPVYCVQP